MALDLSCPLCKKFRHETNHTGASEEDFDRPMAIDGPSLNTHIPSSQPTDNKHSTFHLASQAWVDLTPPAPQATSCSPPPAVATILANIAKWARADHSNFDTASQAELTALPPHSVAHTQAFELGINLDQLIQSLPNV